MRLWLNYLFVLLIPYSLIWGQVKIGGNVRDINSAAILELESTNKGLLLPRLTNEQRDAILLDETMEGLLIFNIDADEIQYLKHQFLTTESLKNSATFRWESANDGKILLKMNNAPKIGQLYYNSTDSSLRIWEGTDWVEIGGAAFFEHSHTITPTPAQQLSLSGTQLSISEGNTVDLLSFIQDNPLLIGPVGPTGPQGPTGAQGPIGPVGPQGPAGVGMSGTDSQTLNISALSSGSTLTLAISQGNTVTLDLSSLNNTSVFVTHGNVTSNASGSLTFDDFVFGANQIDNQTGNKDDARLIFDKSSGAFRAGYASGNSWNESNLGDYSFASGYRTQASGHRTTALGNTTEAHSYAETALGSYNTHVSPKSKASWNVNDRLFVIGNGSSPSKKSDAMVILKNGNIGIGDSTPTEASLVVSGSIAASGNVKANATLTPDYVFEDYFSGNSLLNPFYKRHTLDEVEAFIKANYHLPNIPSAIDIKNQGGIILNQALELQLEKIEELFFVHH